MSEKQIIVALDFPTEQAALSLASRLDAAKCRVKVGKELFTAAGPALVDRLQRMGFQIFLDLKFHDIPNTVAAACRAAASLGVWMLNVHALGGKAMMEASRAAVESVARRPLLIAVTMLTSMGERELVEVGISGSCGDAVMRLASLAQASGLDGVVCSAQEARLLRAALGKSFALVTPGIRPVGAQSEDQQRVTTPAQAIELGVDYLVVGRPITRAPDPIAALDAMIVEIKAAAGAYIAR